MEWNHSPIFFLTWCYATDIHQMYIFYKIITRLLKASNLNVILIFTEGLTMTLYLF